MRQAIHDNSFKSVYRLGVRVAILSALVLSLAVLLGACGDDDVPTAAEPSPVTGTAVAPQPTAAAATTSAPTDDATTAVTPQPTAAATTTSAPTDDATTGVTPQPTAAATTTSVPTDGTSEDDQATQYPLMIDNCGTELVLEAAPQSVITVDTSLAETLVALGVSDRIVGTYFDFENIGIAPENRTVLDELTVLGEGGYPSREAVISLAPDFVFSFTEYDFSQEGSPTREDLAGVSIYSSEMFECDEGVGTVQDSLAEILELGMIFDRQAEAQAIVDEQTARLAEIEMAVADLESPKVIYWDAYDFENVRLLPYGVYRDAAVRAGADVLFPEVTDANPVSKEQIATSDVELVLAIDYGPDLTTPLLPLMVELVSATPAGEKGEDGVIAVTNYPPNLHAVDLVEEIARALHPDINLN